MAGLLLQRDGDVQIGADKNEYAAWGISDTTTFPDPVLLSAGTQAWAGNFSPWTEPQYVTSDIQRITGHGAVAGADSATTRKVEFTIWLRNGVRGGLGHTHPGAFEDKAPSQAGHGAVLARHVLDLGHGWCSS